MNKIIILFLSLIVLTSCVTQKKTIQLENGKYVTEKKFHKMIRKVMKHAKKETRKATGITKKQLRSFERETIVNTKQ